VTLTGATVAAIVESCSVDAGTSRIEVNRSTITGNGVAGIRGSVRSSGTALVVAGSVIAANGAPGADDAPGGVSGSFAAVTVTGSRITDNAEYGLYLDEFTEVVTIRDSVVADNGRTGVHADYSLVTISGSVLSGHTGTGISGYGTDGTISDSTISGNGTGVADGLDGGWTIRRSTFADNGRAYRSPYMGFVRMGGTLVQGAGVGCSFDFGVGPVSLGHNITSDSSCALGGTGDQQGTDALLGPLADNGGPTPTHRPAAGSPAVDAIPVGTTDLCTGTLRDQRGVSRPQGSACDTGAVEQ
jgi:hypothetical protein